MALFYTAVAGAVVVVPFGRLVTGGPLGRVFGLGVRFLFLLFPLCPRVASATFCE